VSANRRHGSGGWASAASIEILWLLLSRRDAA
jgi:hypothetical protein